MNTMNRFAKRSTIALAALIAAGLAACAHGAPASAPEMAAMPPAPAASADLGKTLSTPIIDVKGDTIGEAKFTEGAHGLVIRVTIQAGKLTPGWHGLHLHETGDCSDGAAGFKASGGHVGHMVGLQHGALNPQGPEPGDLPNLFIAGKVASGAEFVSTATALSAQAQGARLPLLDGDGSALIFHAAPDDMTSQPIGGAGARVACAAIKAD
jgi:Cu-Zn family superoxide dismutase